MPQAAPSAIFILVGQFNAGTCFAVIKIHKKYFIDQNYSLPRSAMPNPGDKVAMMDTGYYLYFCLKLFWMTVMWCILFHENHTLFIA